METKASETNNNLQKIDTNKDLYRFSEIKNVNDAVVDYVLETTDGKPITLAMITSLDKSTLFDLLSQVLIKRGLVSNVGIGFQSKIDTLKGCQLNDCESNAYGSVKGKDKKVLFKKYQKQIDNIVSLSNLFSKNPCLLLYILSCKQEDYKIYRDQLTSLHKENEGLRDKKRIEYYDSISLVKQGNDLLNAMDARASYSDAKIDNKVGYDLIDQSLYPFKNVTNT